MDWQCVILLIILLIQIDRVCVLDIIQRQVEFVESIREKALKAILYEVAVTPKPGLVDRNNSGAHNDMDFFTFMASGAALSEVFAACAREGLRYAQPDPKGLLNRIRPIGIEAERRMYLATGGVNTHKGLIFSLGIISAAAASIYREKPYSAVAGIEVSNRVKEMASEIVQRELQNIKNGKPTTAGERNFIKYGLKGIRGQVETGFSTVIEVSLVALKKMLEHKSAPLNDVLVQVLLHLMTVAEDSNVVGRHGIEMLDYVREKARTALKAGGMFTTAGRKYLYEMDRDFIHKGISPGGSADLLAVTIMLYLLENGELI